MYHTSIFHAKFENNGEEIEYFLDFHEGKVKQETLKIDGELKLNREEGKLYYDKVKIFLDFQMEDDKLAVSRVDTIQQPFFEALHNWGKNLNHYRFGGKLGKDTFLRDINAVKFDVEAELKENEEVNVSEIFLRANKKFGETFLNTLIEDMGKLSYPIQKVSAELLKFFPISAIGLGVQENDMEVITDQREMSQGMFRVLSFLVQLNYLLLNQISSCILIDDIGEGLDYQRSKSLVDLMIEKVKNSSVQVIMTTNDRFVMNKIPLAYWSVVHRTPKKALFYNYRNSKETFDEFNYTGLSNFDFLSSEFYFEGFEKQGEL